MRRTRQAKAKAGRSHPSGRSGRIPLVLALWLLPASTSFAQGCAACYTTAASGAPGTAHALRSGILILVFPPVLAFAAIVLAFRRWSSWRSEERK